MISITIAGWELKVNSMLPFETTDMPEDDEEEIDPFAELEIGISTPSTNASNPLAAFEEDDDDPPSCMAGVATSFATTVGEDAEAEEEEELAGPEAVTTGTAGEEEEDEVMHHHQPHHQISFVVQNLYLHAALLDLEYYSIRSLPSYLAFSCRL